MLDGKLSVGALVAASMLAGRVLAPIAGIAAVITRATQTFTALKAIDRIMALERERPPGRSLCRAADRQGRHRLRQRHLSNIRAAPRMRWRKSRSRSPRRARRHHRPRRIGQDHGRPPAHRASTIPHDGRILVDGIDIRQYDPADLRAGIGFVLQDTDLFFGKLRDNIAFGRPAATDEEVLAAARLAGVESFIAGHPRGYDMPIAEGGRSLSGGQKQAIGLARILIRQPENPVPRRADRAFRHRAARPSFSSG